MGEPAPKGSVARVREALAGFGLAAEIKEFDASTRTSAEAAAVRAITGGAWRPQAS